MKRLIPYSMMIALVLTLVGCGGDDGPSGPGNTDPEGSDLGKLEITSSTTGDSMDPDGYTVTVDGDSVNAVDANGTVDISELQEGSYDVELTGVRANCEVDGDNPQAVDVTGGDTESLSFDVVCEEALVNKIAYTNYTGTNKEIFLMDMDGSNSEQLTNGTDRLSYPNISPDGTKILFLKKPGGVTSNWQYFVMDADGTNQTELTTAAEGAAISTTPSASWSPDGSKILFITDRDGNPEIYKMNADGTNQEQLTDNSAKELLHNNAFSADGSKFVFASDRASGGDVNIFIADADGSNVQQVTDNSNRDSEASWSPDGSKIAFISDRDNAPKTDIFTMDTDGNNVNQLTNTSDFDGAPAWSADGGSIIFESNRNGNNNFFKIAADGSGSVNNITSTSDNERSPSVSLLQ